jgi:hypothetical protein
MKTKSHWPIVLFLILVLAVFVAWGSCYLLLANPLPDWLPIPKDANRLSTLASVATAFGLLNTLFTGLAFAGLVTTILLQRHQIESTLDGLRSSADYQTLASLQVRVGEVIADPVIAKTDIRSKPFIEAGVHTVMATRPLPSDNAGLLGVLGVYLLPSHISVSDAFRRRFVFSTLESFFLGIADDERRRTLKNLLLAQLHDEAMRSLILQALADRDEELLALYARLGLNVAVLNEFQDDLCPKLATSFGFRNEDINRNTLSSG